MSQSLGNSPRHSAQILGFQQSRFICYNNFVSFMLARSNCFLLFPSLPLSLTARIIYYSYSALGLVWAETRVHSGYWYSSGMLHPGQVLRRKLAFLSPAF